MKADRRHDQAAIGALVPRAAETTRPPKPPPARVFIAVALVVAVVVAIFVGRHAIARVVVVRGLGFITGDHVEITSFVLGPRQSVLTGVHLTTSSGEALLDAQRVEIRYSLREALWSRSQRYGVSDIVVARPVLTFIRHADGSYNVRAPGVAGNQARPAGPAAPLAFDARISDGTLRLIDRAPVAPDLNEQVIAGIFVDARVRSDRESRARGRGTLLARRAANAGLQSWPIAFSARSDVPRGIAVAQAQAATLPLRGPIGFVQHSGAVRVDDGLLRGFEVRLFALNFGLNEPPDVHAAGRAALTDGELTIAALRKPVRGLHGRLTLTDDGVWTTGLAGTLTGVPLLARGGAFDRLHPQLRLGISSTGDLGNLRSLFAFSKAQPVTGRAHLQTLIEAPVSSILIRTALDATHATYGRLPFRDVRGQVDYHSSSIVLRAVRGRYAAADINVGGRFLLGPTLDSAVVLAARGPGRSLPYAENIAPEATVNAVTVISGRPAFSARASLGVHGSGLDGNALIAVDQQGVGEFGPFAFERRDGSSLVGALRLERPNSLSAAWISARHYRVEVPERNARLPGLSVPGFPPVAGRIDAMLAGGGSPDSFAVTGSLRGRNLRVANAEVGAGQTRIGGTLSDLRLSDLALTGALGRFRGSAAVAAGTVTLRGDYDGSLDRLVPLTGNQSAHGDIHGPVLATIRGRDVVVASPGARLRGGSVRGVEFDQAAGTLAVRGGAFHVITADGTIGGRRAVAREFNGTVAVSAPDLPSRAVRGTGLPLERGNLSVYGVADLRGRAPKFDGTIAVANGQAGGYRVAGDAQIDLDGAQATIFAATGALGSTYGAIGGSIAGIGERALRYDLDTRVPLGDIDLLRGDLRLPVSHLAGSFAANLHVHGAGNRPLVEGTVEAPEGVYNGLAFRDASARLVLDAGGVAADEGRLTIGTTTAAIAASRGGGGFAIRAQSTHAELADFNDFFDAGDTLAGRGRLNLLFRNDTGRIETRGFADLHGLRYRDYPLGDSQAEWHMRGDTVVGQASVTSIAGTLRATGSVTPLLGVRDPIRAFGDAAYDVRGSVERLDLGTWLPAAGVSQPVLGSIDARLQVTGRRPSLGLGIDATLRNASIAGYPVRSGHLRASASGSRIKVVESSADLGFATLSATGALGLKATDPIAFNLRAHSDDIGTPLGTFFPAARGLALSGVLDADIRFSGTRVKPVLEGGFDLENARYGTFTVPRAIGALALAGRAIELRDADVEFSAGQAFVAGSLPLRLQPLGLGPPRAALSFDVTARGVDLAQFAPLFPAGTKLGGSVDGRFGVEGTVDRPRLLGTLTVANGSYLSRFERASIQHVDAQLTFAGSSVVLQAFHAGVGGGTLDAAGHVSLPFAGSPSTGYLLDVRAHAAKLDFPAYGRGTIDGTLRLSGGPAAPLVAGDVRLRDAVIPAAAVYGSSSGVPGAATGRLSADPRFALHAEAGANVRVRSAIVDIGVSGGVDVSGSLKAPRLSGGFVATDGTVSSYNHIFRVVNASATFDPADGVLPTINARATARVSNPDPDPSRNIAGSANITVSVSGTPDSNNLQVAYSSDPPYSQEQIVGLLFDVPALLGAVNFNLNGGAGAALLRGAPGETNALLPPGVTPEQISAISFNQEVFSLLNGQFTQRALNPIERVFEKVFGLSDLEFTVDYGGGLGYSLRRQIGKNDFSAFLSQTVTFPERSNFGFELDPKPFETVNFSYYQQNGVTSLITNQTPGAAFSLGSTRRLTSVQPLGNRSGFSLDFNRRL